MKATLYVPGQPAQELSQEQVNNLALGVAADGLLTCWGEVVEGLLNACEVDVLFVSESVAVWGVENAGDYADAQLNEQATDAAMLGSELYGPILIVQA